MNPKIIALIYFYLISAGALILIVIGVFTSVSYAVNTTQFKEYPLPYYENCDMRFNSMVPAPAGEASMSAEEEQKAQQTCEQNLEQRRVQQKVDDLKGAITFSLVGLILFGIHFPLARKYTNSKS